MANSFKVFSLLVLLVFGRNCFSQSVANPYEVATWQGFRSAAISYTFDDNSPSQLAVAVPMFDSLNFKLTLFTISNIWPNWRGLQFASNEGHEIASHTVSHPYLDSISEVDQVAELRGSQDAINVHVIGQKCMTIAYPYGHIGDTSLVRQFYIAGRGTQMGIERSTPKDFMNIRVQLCGLGPVFYVQTTADFDSADNRAAKTNGWCVYVVHCLDNEKGDAPLRSEVLRASVLHLKANQDKFWVATFGDVVKYIRERNSVSVFDVAIKPDSIIVKVTDTLDNSIYNCPITVRRPLPLGWDSSIVIENGKIISSQIVEIDTVKYIMFNVIPRNGGNVVLKKETIAVEQVGRNSSSPSFELYQNYPNPFNPTTVISYQVPMSSQVSLKAYDILGREVASLVDERKDAGRYDLSFNANNLSSGIYLYRLQAGSYSSTKKFLLLK